MTNPKPGAAIDAAAGTTATGAEERSPVLEERIPVLEERATVRKEAVERVAARIHLRTHEEEVPLAATLRREHVEVERVPVDLVVDEPPAPREEGELTVIPVVEEVLVRRFRIVEEIHVRRRAETSEVTDTVTLRRQEALIDEEPPRS